MKILSLIRKMVGKALGWDEGPLKKSTPSGIYTLVGMKIGYENWVYIPFIGHLLGSPGLNSYSGPGTSIPNGGSKLESRGDGTHLRCVIFGANPTWHILLEVFFSKRTPCGEGKFEGYIFF